MTLLKDKKGYTLVEMVILIAIMAILTGGIASYIGYINNGKTKKSIETFKSKLDRVQTDNMSKTGKTFLYLYKTGDGIFCKIVNHAESSSSRDGFVNRTELNAFLSSSPDTSSIAGDRVDVKATGKTDTGAAANLELDDNNMIKIGFDKATGAFSCSNNGSVDEFFDKIEFSGTERFKIKLVKTTGKHIEV